MRAIIKKIGAVVSSRVFYLILGVFLAAGFVAYATWDGARTGGSGELSESNWNELVNMIEANVGGGGSEAITGLLNYSQFFVKPSDGSKQLYTRAGSGCIHSLKALNYEQLGLSTYFGYHPNIRFIIDGQDSGYIFFRYTNFPVEEIAYPKTNYIYHYVNIPETICYDDSIEIWANVTQSQCSTCNTDMNLFFRMLWSEK